jgi:hypothetical protein
VLSKSVTAPISDGVRTRLPFASVVLPFMVKVIELEPPVPISSSILPSALGFAPLTEIGKSFLSLSLTPPTVNDISPSSSGLMPLTVRTLLVLLVTTEEETAVQEPLLLFCPS